jgi:molybdenum cofactor cytidylyltransferase
MSLDSNPMGFGVILLAAGASSRMGRPKMLLPWNGTSILGHLIATWQRVAVGQIAVVVSENGGVVSELDRLGFSEGGRIVNPNPEEGMFSSIRVAALWSGWKETLSHWVIVLGDQPHLSEELLAALVNHAAQHPEAVCQPGRGGRPRHPVVVPENVFGRLRTTRCGNLKQFLAAEGVPVSLMNRDDPGLDFDLDRPADYAWAVSHGMTGGGVGGA